MTAQQVFAVDDFRDAIASDLAARGTAPDVLVGEWNTSQLYGAPRVVVGIGPFLLEDPAGMRLQGADIAIDKPPIDPLNPGAYQPDEVASPILSRTQTYQVWVHSVAASTVDPAVAIVETRRATTALLDKTLAAIRRSLHGLVFGWTPGKVLSEERADFVYGSVVTFGVVIAVPILGDAMELGASTESQTTTQADIDGTLTPAETGVDDGS